MWRAMRSAAGRLIRADRGSVAAEFAVTLPAVLLVVMLVAGLAQVQGQRLLLQDVAADAARLASRGDDPGGVLGALDADTTLEVHSDAGLVCVRLASSARLLGIEVPFSAEACALDEGR